MWKVRHFRSSDAAMAFIATRNIQWERIFVENKPYSIIYKPIRVISL